MGFTVGESNWFLRHCLEGTLPLRFSYIQGVLQSALPSQIRFSKVLEGFALPAMPVLLSLVFGELVLLTREAFLSCGPNRAQGSVNVPEI